MTTQFPSKFTAVLVYARPILVFGGMICALTVMWGKDPYVYTLGVSLLPRNFAPFSPRYLCSSVSAWLSMSSTVHIVPHCGRNVKQLVPFCFILVHFLRNFDPFQELRRLTRTARLPPGARKPPAQARTGSLTNTADGATFSLCAPTKGKEG